jgi:site-specific recombinase XerD
MKRSTRPRPDARSPSGSGRSPLYRAQSVALTLGQAGQRYLLDLEVGDRSPKTLKWYRQKLAQLEKAWGDPPLAEIEREQVLGFLAELRRAGRSSPYVRGWYQVFRGFFGWAREQGYPIHPSLVNENSAHWFSLKKPIETTPDIYVFNPEELELIVAVAGEVSQPGVAERNRLLIRLLRGTGLRLSEALGLELQDVQDTQLRVRQGKGRKPRWVPLNRRLQRDLERYLERWRPESDSEAVLLTAAGQPMTEYAVASLFRRIRRETGLPVHPHALRHSFATGYLREGGDLDRLRRILGHATFAMSAKYVHLAGVDLGRDIDKLT